MDGIYNPQARFKLEACHTTLHREHVALRDSRFEDHDLFQGSHTRRRQQGEQFPVTPPRCAQLSNVGFPVSESILLVAMCRFGMPQVLTLQAGHRLALTLEVLAQDGQGAAVVCIHIYIYTHTHIGKKHVNTCVEMHLCTHTCTYTHIYTNVCVCTPTCCADAFKHIEWIGEAEYSSCSLKEPTTASAPPVLGPWPSPSWSKLPQICRLVLFYLEAPGTCNQIITVVITQS